MTALPPPADSTKRRRAGASIYGPSIAPAQPFSLVCSPRHWRSSQVAVPVNHACCPVSNSAIAPTRQNTKGDWPHVFFGVPPFDHTTCAKGFDYKTAAACPAAGNGTSPDMYYRIASYAHTILEK